MTEGRSTVNCKWKLCPLLQLYDHSGLVRVGSVLYKISGQI